MWRGWVACVGLPLGLLAGLAVFRSPASPALEIASLLGALVLAAATQLIARRHADAPDRGPHLANAASAALVAVPFVLAVLFDVGPGPWPWVGFALLWTGVALWRAARSQAPTPGAARRLGRVVSQLAGGCAVVLVTGLLWAALGGVTPPLPERFRSAAFDVDARVPLAPEVDCRPEIARFELALERGSRPRFGPGGDVLWFEADGPDGRRQVHRLDLEGRETTCWTCGEPGNNRRPAPHPTGTTVLFDTDRFATARYPDNTDVMVATTRGEGAPVRASRRLTHDPGSDDHALYDPSGRGFAWTRGSGGRYRVVRASIQPGHGGFLLGDLTEVLRDGAAWVGLVHWSTDARLLAGATGHPLRTLRVVAMDPAQGSERPLVAAAAPGVAVSTSQDGRRTLVASTSAVGLARVLPGWMGFLLARLPGVDAAPLAGLYRGTDVSVGTTGEALEPVALGEIAGWGVPTGVALAPDGRAFVLGQRRDGAERLLWIELACADLASR